ncbi:MAG: GrpB family protein [Candidatus Doudnabacteria bacterium]|nr:GrpB family protein [Candidatus Doudnabacteria bacterium]
MLTEVEKNFLDNLDYKSSNRAVRIYPWDARSLDVGQEIVAEIQQMAPNLEILFGGSAPLRIAGEKDIDISVYCPKPEQAKYVPKLETLFGKPASEGESHTGWVFEREGFHVTVYLTDLASPNTKVQKELFELLQSHPELAKEYEQIKLEQNGKSYKEYQIAKYEFYHKVLGL